MEILMIGGFGLLIIAYILIIKLFISKNEIITKVDEIEDELNETQKVFSKIYSIEESVNDMNKYLKMLYRKIK
jgi:hypothetical protein